MRRLIYVPVIHTEMDMGSLSETLKREYIKKYGSKRWQWHQRVVNDMWQGIRKKILGLKLDYKRTRIYQDGLPFCGEELKIVQDIAASGSQNYQIVLDLIKRGGKLEGTEDSNLLSEEYEYLKQMGKTPRNQGEASTTGGDNGKGDDILAKRDRFIAKRIADTLRQGEMGMLFIGLKHKVNEILPRDISITYLIYRLPFKESTV